MARIKLLADIGNANSTDWTIDGVLSGLTLLWGGPGTGKSFTAVSMAASVATGCAWVGHETKQGPVLYIAGEGGEVSVAHRLRTALEDRGQDLDEMPHLIEIGVLSPGIDLVEHGGTLLDYIDSSQLRKPPRLIIVDTLSRCFSGDENKQEFMSKFVNTLDLIRDHYKCDILVVHHANKQNEVRGSSVLFGAVDVSWRLTQWTKRVEGEKNMVMRADKLRELASDEAVIHFRMVNRKLFGPRGMTVVDGLGQEQQTLVVKPIKEDVENAKLIKEAFEHSITGRSSVTYDQIREIVPAMSRSVFDKALTFVLTSPAHWGIIRSDRVGTFERYHPGMIEPVWPRLIGLPNDLEI